MVKAKAPRAEKARSFPIVGIGASAGGLEALTSLLKALPTNLGMAYVIIQHLSPKHESMLPDILRRATAMPVEQVADGVPIKADHVYVIPPNTYMGVVDGHLKLSPRIHSRGGLHSIDHFLTTLAEVYHNNAIGIILSGTATDGTIGLQSVKAHGGITFAQDDTAAFKGMPESAAASGFVDFVCSPEQMTRELAAIRQHPYTVQPEQAANLDERELRKIHIILHTRRGVDFSHYKQSTINRRILRRMALARLQTLTDYVSLLRENATEIDLLYRDLLINVTSFFREPTLFETLSRDIFPQLLKERKPGEPIRIWVPACSTGEEACSLAICLFEYLGDEAISTPIQIFATDLSEAAIDKARTGVYYKSALENVSPKRLSRFFTRLDGHYQVIKPIRDVCIFATHNLLKDPPFSRMDLISCQNVMIYLESMPQKNVLQAFHYALKDSGYLVLGKSETIGNTTDLFQPEDKEHKIYSKKLVKSGVSFGFSLRMPGLGGIIDTPAQTPVSHRQTAESDVDRETDKILLSRYVPASVVINKDMHILRFNGNTAPYLQPATGKASLHVLKMIRDELVFELRNLLLQAKKEGLGMRKEGIHLPDGARTRDIIMEVVPVPIGNGKAEPCYLILFQESGLIITEPEQSVGADKTDSRDRRIRAQEQELSEAREHMKTMSEDFEATREELQSANEEVLSANEELQSINEELETSKEELQSTNEELSTINDELQLRNNELREASEYSQAVVETIREPLVVLHADLRVRMANWAFYATFNLKPEGVEGQFFHELGNGLFNVPELRTNMDNLLRSNKSFENFEVRKVFPGSGERTLLFNAMRMSPDKGSAARVLLVIENITERRQAEEELRWLASIVNSSSDAILSFSPELTIASWNPGAIHMFGHTAQEAIGKAASILSPPETKEALINLGEEVLKHNKSIIQWETISVRRNGDRFHALITASPLHNNGRIAGISAVVQDISERKQAELKLRESEERLRLVVESAKDYAIFTTDPDRRVNSWNKGAEAIFGYSEAEIMGRLADVIFTPEDVLSGAPIREAQTALTEGYAMDERWHIRKDGSRFYASGVMAQLRDSKLHGFVKIARDLTERMLAEQRLRESEERYQSFIAQSTEGVWRFELEHPIDISLPADKQVELLYSDSYLAECNDVLARMYGYQNAGEMKNKRVTDFLPRGRTETYLQAFIESGYRLVDAESREFDQNVGERYFLNNLVGIIEEGRLVRAWGTQRDITERKALEKLKEDFIGIASHELRTPVTSIKAYVELLQDILTESNDPENAALIGKLDSQVDRLTDLVKDLLDVTRISEGKMLMRKESFSVNAIIREVVEELQRTTKHKLSISLQEGGEIQADRDRIRQVIVNLVSNAIKYSPDTRPVHISSSIDAGLIRICVQDHGIGMSAESRNKVFERFYRASDPTISTYPGLGLGLFIASEIVHRHGGKIWVDSERGKGSVFCFTLPDNNEIDPSQKPEQ